MRHGKSFLAEQLRRLQKVLGKAPAVQPEAPFPTAALKVETQSVPKSVIASGAITSDQICAGATTIHALHGVVRKPHTGELAKIQGRKVLGVYVDEYGVKQQVAMTQEEYRDMQVKFPREMRESLIIDNIWNVGFDAEEPDTQADDEVQNRTLAEENQSLRKQLKALKAENETLKKSKQDKYIEESLF